MVLLERDDELEVLRRAVADAAQGHGCAVLVRGAAGTGKSSLVEAAAAQVRHPGRVLRAACDALSTPTTLGAVRDLAMSLRGTRTGTVLGSSSDVVELARALVAELGPPEAPSLLVVEDAHWADSASADVLTYLIRRCRPLRTAVVVTYRDDDLDDDGPWRRALGVLTDPHVHRLALAPLTPGAVATLAAGTDLDPREVHRVTGGNPLYVRELVASGGMDPTATIRDIAARRLTTVPGPCRRLVECLCAVPGRAERALAETLDEQEALATAERRRLLEGDASYVWFPHELLRRAVEETLTAQERRHQHRRVLRALVDGVAGAVPPARLVHHADGAGDRPAVARYAPAAATAAMAAGAHREALEHFRRALADPSRLAVDSELRLRADYARELWNQNLLDEARAEAERVIASCAGPRHDRFRAHALTTLAISLVGDDGPAAAAATAEAAVVVLDQYEVSEDLGWALAWLAAVSWLSPRHDRAVFWADRAIEVGRRLGNDGIVGHGLVARALALRPPALDDLRAGLARFTTTPLRGHRMWALHTLGVELSTAGDARGAIEAFRDCQDLAKDIQLESWVAGGLVGELDALLSLGQWAVVEEVARRELRRPPAVPDVRSCELHGLLAVVLARRGERGAQEHADECWRVAVAWPKADWRIVAALYRLEVALLHGRAADVADDTRYALHIAQRAHQVWTHSRLAVAARRAGLDVGAVPDCPEPWRSSLAGDHLGAARQWGIRGDRYEQAWELAATQDEDSMLEGLRLLDDLGAAGAALVLRRRLRARGLRVPAGPRAATRATPAGLTARQAEVASLLAEGLTDAEIAERLVVSVRTVHHHVSAVLQTLGVHTRREAAAQAAALGLMPPEPRVSPETWVSAAHGSEAGSS